MASTAAIYAANPPGNESQQVVTTEDPTVSRGLQFVAMEVLVTTTTTSTTTTTVPPTTTTTTTTVPPTTTTTEVPVQVVEEVAPPEPSGECGGWLQSISSRWPADQVGTACRVMLCESGGNPTVSNHGGSGASGLWQFMPGTWESTTGTPAPAAAYGGDVQTAAAFKLWQQSGWGPWSCY